MKTITYLTLSVFLFGALLFAHAASAQTASTPGALRSDLKNPHQKVARVTQARVTAVSGSLVTITKDGKTYTVTLTTATKFRRHYWGSSSLQEIKVNDTVSVWGTWTTEAQTTIKARLIRDTSLMKRRGVFFGDVKSVSATGFVLTSKNRGDQTVTVSTTSILVNRQQVSMPLREIHVGDRIRVKGLWDKTVKTVTEVTQVKDFSLPAKTTGTPTR